MEGNSVLMSIELTPIREEVREPGHQAVVKLEVDGLGNDGGAAD